VCAENHRINDTINLILTAIDILLISNRNSFRVVFDETASAYLIRKMYLYTFSIGNGQPREPALCPLCRHTFVTHVQRLRFATPVSKKGSPYSITERRVPELIPVLGSQPACDVSHKAAGRLPAVTLATLKRAATNFAS